MAFGAELTALLRLDATSYYRTLSQVTASAGGLGKALNRKLGTQDAFKSLVAGIGISVESIAEKIAEAWAGGTKEGLKKVHDLYEQEAKLIEKNIFDRLPNGQARRTFIDREMKRAQAEIDRPRGSITTSPIDPEGMPRTVFTESEVEYETRRATARARLAELQSKIIDEDKKTKDETLQVEKQLDETAERRLMKELDVHSRVSLLIGKKVAAEIKLENTTKGTLDYKKAEVELNKAAVELIDAQKDAEEDITKTRKDNADLAKKQADELKKARNEAIQLRNAEQGVDKAGKQLNSAKLDPLTVTLAQAAAGEGGVTQTTKAKAREIMRLEDRARRVFQSGSADMRDPNGKPISPQDYAQQLMGRAEQLRANAGFLKPNEREPFREATESLRKSEEHLADIRESLTLVETDE